MKGRSIVAMVFAAGVLAGMVLEYRWETVSIIARELRHVALTRELWPLSNRTEVPFDALRGKPTMVALAFGQSNAANGGETPGRQHPAVYELYRGRLYSASDPLLGADGDGGSVWLRVAAKAVDSGEFGAVVLVPFAVSATGISRWAPGGDLHDALLAKIARAQGAGLRFTHLLWHQGEADAGKRTGADAYQEGFLAMLGAIRRAGVDAPIYVAIASRCGRVRESASVRGAQVALRNPASGIMAGPDTDVLGFSERYDGCHFSTEGLEKAAGLWWDAIRAKR